MALKAGAVLCTISCIILVSAAPGLLDLIPQPRNNLWKALAHSLGQDHICLNAESAEDPLSSCLVGIPISYHDCPSLWGSSLGKLGEGQDPTWAWGETLSHLPAVPEEPLEFKLLGSANASLCVRFSIPDGFVKSLHPDDTQWTRIEEDSSERWCSRSLIVCGPSVTDFKPRKLPQGFYFICRNRAWNGIPSRLFGGPCTIGHVSLFTPSTPKIENWFPKGNEVRIIRQKRDLTEFGPDCDSKIFHWNEGKRVAVSLFLPWVSAGKAIAELGKLECWSVKQANLTSTAIAGLLADERITRQAVLQNRAALDYLLLLHHHRCEEFEGLHCFNLSSKAQNVQEALSKMQGLISDIKKETENWLGNFISGLGLSGWAGSLLKDILFGVFIILAVVLGCSLIWALVKRLIARLASPSVNMVNFPEAPCHQATAPPQEEIFEEEA